MSIITRTLLEKSPFHQATVQKSLLRKGLYRKDALIRDRNLVGVLLISIECKEREISEP